MVSSFFHFLLFLPPFLIWVNMIPISAINNKVNKMANIQKVVTTQPEAMRVMATFVGIGFLYHPRLTSYFSYDPSALRSDICQRNTRDSQIGDELEFFEFSFLGIPPGADKQQNE